MLAADACVKTGIAPVARVSPMGCCRGLSTCTPSLANLVSQMLGRSLRQEGAPHDCEQDAAAAMQLVNHALQHGVPEPMNAPDIKVWDVLMSISTAHR